ncbi:MAG: hypothetical protein IPM21_10290 [Acidobacteria bacterium]|nr:hypothetical protein [Acidobacteriota bacterium]
MRGSRTFFRILIALTAVFAITVLLLFGARAYLRNDERVIAEFRDSLVYADYASLYEHSSQQLRNNVDEKEFARRMAILRDFLMKKDPELVFVRDIETENLVNSVTDGVDKSLERKGVVSRFPRRAESNHHWALLRVGGQADFATVHISWVDEGLVSRNLLDLSSGMFESPNDFVNTISGEPFQ